MRTLLVMLVATLFSGAASCATPAGACSALSSFADGRLDASPALSDCLRQTPAGGRVDLAPGIYRLQQPVSIARSVTIATLGSQAASVGCDQAGARCATLLIDPRRMPAPNSMPVEIAAGAVTFDRLIVRGISSSGRLRGACGRPDQRPAGGGLRVIGAAQFTLTRSVLRDFTCFTALEVHAGARHLRIEKNLIGPNGDHRPGEIWSDGVTIHDAVGAIVRDNRFVDNTDVQLILGGCQGCRIERNRFSHGGTFSGAAFAELMIHAWPNTSGNYTGTVVAGNHIDCGRQRRCGYGIMIGSAPWYPGRAAGGVVSGNAVSNAQIGINIDALSGPMEIRGNQVRASGGRFASDCGVRDWPAVNVGPASQRFVRGDPSDVDERSNDSRGCLLSRTGN